MRTRISYRTRTLCLALLLAVSACVATTACDTAQTPPETDATENTTPDVTTSAVNTEPDVTTAAATETATDTEPETAPETAAPDITDRVFAMSYEFVSGKTATVRRGCSIAVTLTIRNDGEPFEMMGSSSGFSPTARLVGDHGETVECLIIHTNDFVILAVETGETSSCHGDFLFDSGIATGAYDLVLSFGDESVTFEDVVTVE